MKVTAALTVTLLAPTEKLNNAAKKIQRTYSLFHNRVQAKMAHSIDSVAIMEGRDPKSGKAIQYVLKSGQTAIKTEQLGAKAKRITTKTEIKTIRVDQKSVVMNISEKNIAYGVLEAKEKAYTLAQFQSVTPYILYSKNNDDKELIITAQNGGKDLHDLNGIVPIDSFKDLVYELPAIHAQGLYPTDIKLENLVFKNEKVRHIDVDDIPSANDIEANTIMHTPYTAHRDIALKCYYYKKDHGFQPEILLKTYSTCALMLSIMIATDSTLYKKACTGNIWSDRYFNPNEDLPILNTWICNNIKAEHQEIIKSFLKKPLENSSLDTLYHSIQWKSDVPPKQTKRQLPNWSFTAKTRF